MAIVFTEGWDKYGAPALSHATLDISWKGQWDTDALASAAIVAPLSSYGYALQMKDASWGNYFKSIATQTVCCGGVRISLPTLVNSQCGPGYFSGGTGVFQITVNTDGSISIRTNRPNGTAIGTSATGLITAGSVHYLEWKVTLNSSTGHFDICLDGNTVITGSGNTSNGQASANQFGFNMGDNQVGVTGTLTVDDLYLDNAGPMLNTNPIVETQYPNSTTSSQWSQGSVCVGKAYLETSTTAGAPGANFVMVVPVTPDGNVTLTSVGILPAANSAGAKWKGVLYSDSGGNPNTLIVTGSEVTGVNASTLSQSTISTTTLTGGTQYWLGYMTDTSFDINESDTLTLGQKKTNTYGSGAPATLTGTTSGLNDWFIVGIGPTRANQHDIVNLNPAAMPFASLLSYIKSATINQEDLYGFPALQSSPNNVYSVAVKAFNMKSDSNARTVELQMSSAGTDSSGSTFTPNSVSLTWGESYFTTDPHTSGTWTESTVNAALSGIKLAS